MQSKVNKLKENFGSYSNAAQNTSLILFNWKPHVVSEKKNTFNQYSDVTCFILIFIIMKKLQTTM